MQVTRNRMNQTAFVSLLACELPKLCNSLVSLVWVEVLPFHDQTTHQSILGNSLAPGARSRLSTSFIATRHAIQMTFRASKVSRKAQKFGHAEGVVGKEALCPLYPCFWSEPRDLDEPLVTSPLVGDFTGQSNSST